jgi:hypothetical protein
MATKLPGKKKTKRISPDILHKAGVRTFEEAIPESGVDQQSVEFFNEEVAQDIEKPKTKSDVKAMSDEELNAALDQQQSPIVTHADAPSGPIGPEDQFTDPHIGGSTTLSQVSDEQLDSMLNEQQAQGMTTRKALQTINAGIADILDLPGDVAAGVTNMIGGLLGMEEIPSGGIRQLMELVDSQLGISLTLPENELPQGPVADAFRFLGQSIGLLPVAGLLPRIPAQTAVPVKPSTMTGKIVEKVIPKGALKQTGRFIGQSAVDAPVGFAVTEAASGFGAGLLFGESKEHTDDPSMQFLAGVTGGLMPSISMQILKGFGFMGFRLLNDARMSLTKSKGDPRAADRLNRELIHDDEVVSFKDEDVLEEFLKFESPAQSTGNKALLSIERAILESDDVSMAVKAEGDTRLAELNNVIIRSLNTDTGEPGDFVATLEQLRAQQGYMKTMWKARIDIAQKRAKLRIKEVGPKINKEASQKIVNEEIQSALKDAVETQKQLWARSPNPKTSAVSLKQAWRKLISDRTRVTSKGDLRFSDSSADDLIKELGHMDYSGGGETGVFVPGRMPDEVSVKFLQDLRSRILDDIRKKQATEPSSNKKRIFHELQNTILGIFKNLESDIIKLNPDGTFTPPDQRLLNAINFTREMNQNFNQGPLAPVLKKNTQGGYVVEPTMTLNVLMGKGLSVEQRTANMRALKTAITRETKAADAAKRLGVENDADSFRPTTEAVQAYIKHTFVEDMVDPNGRIMVDKANAWFKENREFFKLFDSSFKKQFRDAIDADAPLSLVEDQSTTIKGIMNNKERASAVRFIEQDPIKIFDDVIGSFNADFVRKDMNILVRKVKRDKSGEALKGFQQSVFDWILERSILTGEKGLDGHDKAFVSGFKMTEFLKQKQVRAIIETVLSPEQQNRLTLAHNSAKKLDAFRRTGASAEGIIADSPAWILDFIGRVGGAQVGRQVAGKLGGGTVQTPGAFASRSTVLLRALVKDHAKNALIEAFTADSPDRLRALLMIARTPAEQAFQTQQLDAWFVELLMRYNIDPENQE